MTFNFKLSRLFSKIETQKAAFYFFFHHQSWHSLRKRPFLLALRR